MVIENGQGMDRRTIVPLRNAVETLAHGITELTRRFPSHTASLGSVLRDNAVALVGDCCRGVAHR